MTHSQRGKGRRFRCKNWPNVDPDRGSLFERKIGARFRVMSGFQANDKVVCINDDPLPLRPSGFRCRDFTLPGGLVKQGDIYCVRGVHLTSDGQLGLFLVGKPVFVGGEEVAWHHARFRKIEPSEAKPEKNKKLADIAEHLRNQPRITPEEMRVMIRAQLARGRDSKPRSDGKSPV